MIRILSLLFVSTSAALIALPQNPPAPKPPTQPAPRSAEKDFDNKSVATEADSIFASWLLVGSSNEIALAQLAQQKATNADVKQFAQKLIDDHRQMLVNLRPFETNGSVSGKSAAGSKDDASRPNQDASRAAKSLSDFDHVGLIQELGDQCLETSRRELDQKQGPEFDRCFVGMAIGQHMGTNDMLTVFQRHASSALKPVLTDGQRIVQSHLQEAKDLAKRLEGSSKTSLGASDSVGGGK